MIDEQAGVRTYLPMEIQNEMIKLRGRILSVLRNSASKMLYIALSDEKNTLIQLQNGKIVIAFKNKFNYNYCNTTGVVETLKSLFSQELGEEVGVELVHYDDKEPDAMTTAEIIKLFSGAGSINVKRR